MRKILFKKYQIIIIFFILIVFLYISFKYLYINTTPCYNTEDGKKLPIIMYHQISEKDKLLNKFSISPKQFEKDMLYLIEKGYESISIKQLLNHVYEDEPLPEKPIIITFDDGHESFYTYIYPILKKYNLKAVLSIVGSFTNAFSENEDHNIDYSYLTWEELNEMANSPYVEIGNHTYDLHSIDKGRKGCTKKECENIDTYRKFLEKDILKLQQEILNYTGYEAKVFTYPFGRYSKETKGIIKDFGFSAILTCAEIVNTIDKNNPDFLFSLGRFNRPHGINTKDFFEKILKDV